MICRNQAIPARMRAMVAWAIAGVAMIALAAPAHAGITFDGFMSWQPTSAFNLATFDASGSDKLVVVATGEHNFNQSAGGQIYTITYDGLSLTKAVDVDPKKIDEGGHGDTATDIWYLDNPGAFHTSGALAASVSGNGNNYVFTAIALSGTLPGVGATATAPGTSSVNLTTTAADSMVIFNVGMGGAGNTASPLPGVTATSPTGAVTIDGLKAGSNWAGHAVARATISSPGPQTFSFSTTNTDVATIAAEFLAVPQPESFLKCQLGLLDLSANGGINPATGEPWKYGDTYRFAFHTNSDTGRVTGNESTDIAWYNAFVQNLADASTAYGISAADGATWKVIGSTAAINARDNTETNPNVDGFGEAIFLLDGTTLIASNYSDLWDGSLQSIINLTERGEIWSHWPYTGTKTDGTARDGGSHYGPLGPGTTGQGNAGNPSEWVWRTWTGRNGDLLPLYALSMPLSVIPEPSSALLALLGLVGLLMMRRKR